jgi:hypothetical protein
MFENLLGAASKLLGGSGDSTQEQITSAITSHVGGLDAGDLVSHLIGMVPNLPDDARTQLASTVMGALGANGSDANAVEAAGVPVTNAMSGDHAALGALLEHAASDPSSLKDAAISFIQNNPQIVQQYAPDLIKGVLSKFGA